MEAVPQAQRRVLFAVSDSGRAQCWTIAAAGRHAGARSEPRRSRYSCEKDAADLTLSRNIRPANRTAWRFLAVAGTGGRAGARTVWRYPGAFFRRERAGRAGACAAALGRARSRDAADGAGHGARACVGPRAELVPVPMRTIRSLIDYAHSPDGVENVLQRRARLCRAGVSLALFGCGGDRDRTKRPKMGAIAAKLSDFCIVTSDNPRTEKPEAIIDDILEGMKDTKTPYARYCRPAGSDPLCACTSPER